MSAERVVSEHDESMVAPELPTVSVILPVLNEAGPARALPACRFISRAIRPYARWWWPTAVRPTRRALLRLPSRTWKWSTILGASVRLVSNAAIAAARGEIIVRVDARTALCPDYVERCVEALRALGRRHRRRPDALRGR